MQLLYLSNNTYWCIVMIKLFKTFLKIFFLLFLVNNRFWSKEDNENKKDNAANLEQQIRKSNIPGKKDGKQALFMFQSAV